MFEDTNPRNLTELLSQIHNRAPYYLIFNETSSGILPPLKN